VSRIIGVEGRQASALMISRGRLNDMRMLMWIHNYLWRYECERGWWVCCCVEKSQSFRDHRELTVGARVIVSQMTEHPVAE